MQAVHNQVTQGVHGRLFHIFSILAAIILSVLIGLLLGGGNLLVAALIVAGLIGVRLIMGMGENYWYLLPIGFSFAIPAIPLGPRSFDLWEICTAVVTLLFLARMSIKRDFPKLLRLECIPIFLFLAWVFMVYMHNPVGLLTLGASSGGLRFYVQIGLAFAAFTVLSSKVVTEQDARQISLFMVLGAVVTSLYTAFKYRAGATEATTEFYTWHQALSLIPSTVGAFLFAKYPLREIFGLKRPWIALTWVALLLLSWYSGKRAITAVYLLYPFFAAAIKANNKAPAIFYAVFMGTLLTILIGGNRQFYDLPLGMQRALSILPGDWDPRVTGNQGEIGGMSDSFREKMRELAWQKINRSPWLGRGIGIDTTDLAYVDIHASYEIITMLAAGGAWHSTWLGIMADLGIPAAFLWALFIIFSLRLAYDVYQKSPEGSWRKILACAIILLFLNELMRSYTSGNAYSGPINQWWLYGILLSIRYSLRAKNAIPSPKFLRSAARLKSPAPVSPPDWRPAFRVPTKPSSH